MKILGFALSTTFSINGLHKNTDLDKLKRLLSRLENACFKKQDWNFPYILVYSLIWYENKKKTKTISFCTLKEIVFLDQSGVAQKSWKIRGIV